MKKCELCKSTATIYCDSDRASLCWTCDAQVHSANFLVAKHSRTLLCKICQSPTSWTAVGEKLPASTASICGNCDVYRKERDGGYDGESYNHVMLRNFTPPPAASSSGADKFFSAKGEVVKRRRENLKDGTFKDELDCSSVTTHQHKTTSCHSTVSSSNSTIMKNKRIHQRSKIYDDYTSVSRTKIAKFDLNLSP